MGVITSEDIPCGREFGPYPVGPSILDPGVGIAWRTQHFVEEEHKIKINPDLEPETWLPLVQTAKDIRDQNLEALLREGRVYYRVIRHIPALEELLVWYGDEFAAAIGLKDIKDGHNVTIDGSSYCCPYCKTDIRMYHSFLAHVAFLCPRLHGEPSGDKRNKTDQDLQKLDQRDGMTAESRKRKRSGGDENQNTIKRRSPHEEGQKETSHCQMKNDVMDDDVEDVQVGHGSGKSAFKRVEKKNPDVDNIVKSESAGGSFRRKSPPGGTFDQDGHPIHVPKPVTMTVSHASSSYLYTNNPFMSFLRRPNIQSGQEGEQSENFYGKIAQLFPQKLFELGSVLPANKPVDLRTNVTPTVSSICVQPTYPQSTSLEQRGSILPKPNTNMIERLLNTNPLLNAANPFIAATPFNLTQNWCAKCNATFRMTSDLVYHMRTHHKKETDQEKKKRGDKLRCNVCNETFRERHHLTRHMTSHL
ncbi:PR domain zinc finger protein 8 [Lingula anatina]|uniref:PR domain zinc finger protein 8 n=1 Tax=Lingula anatina TaxID=7574 RepID=A0A1S3KGH1_LINAN|nr:PR domain zinc finger protein 8 [Lingula anatina]|eukprot:XP_013421582.1 PR domain zinc finger protein 8 [Lingula anatina]